MCAAGAPPPDAAEGWVQYVDPSSGYAYYHNPVTGESVWAEGEASSGEEVGSGSPLSGARGPIAWGTGVRGQARSLSAW